MDNIIKIRSFISQKLANRKQVIVYKDGETLRIETKTNVFARFFFRLTHKTYRSAELIQQYASGLDSAELIQQYASGLQQIDIADAKLRQLKPLNLQRRSEKTQMIGDAADRRLQQLKITFPIFALKAATSDNDAKIVEQFIVKKFLQVPNGKNLVLYNGQVLGSDGLRKALAPLKINAHVCNGLKSFGKELNKLKKSKHQEKIAFLVFSANAGKEASYGHVTPVLVEKNGNNIHTLIMDSIGNKNYSTSFSYRSVIEQKWIMFPLYSSNTHVVIKKHLPQAKVYISNVQRQYDNTNCSMFSLNDVKQFFKQKDLFEWIDQYGKGQAKEDEEYPYTEVYHLPPEHMKLAQSTKLLPLGTPLKTWGPDGKAINAKARIRMAKTLHRITEELALED